MSKISREWTCWSGEISARSEILSLSRNGITKNVIEIYENDFGPVYVKDSPENRRHVSMMADKGIGCNGVSLTGEQRFGNVIVYDKIVCDQSAQCLKQR